ncbi:MAG: hypothetical protein R3D52_04930 [Xanthobacteraceae bacterium]
MFEGIILRWRTRVEALVKCGIWGAIAVVALLGALLFLGAAVFVYAQAEFGTLPTLLGFGGLFLAVALIAVIAIAVVRAAAARRQQRIAATASPIAALLDPGLIAAGLNLGKTLGGRRTIAIGLVGAFIVGLWLSGNIEKK